MIFNKRMRRTEQILFYRQLGMMLANGIILKEALDLVDGQSFPALSHELKDLKQQLSAGTSVQTILAGHPRLFGFFPFELILDAQDGAKANRIFQLAADQIEKVAEVRERSMRAFWYPAVTLFLGFLVFMLLCIFVLPSFEKMFSDFGGALPGPTQVLLNLGTLVKDYFVLMLLVAVAVAMFALQFREATVNLVSRLPLFGVLLQKLQVYFFSRNLRTLLAIGMPLHEALGFSARAVHYGPLGHTFADSLSASVGLDSLRPLLEQSGCYPRMILQMLEKSAVGEGGVAETMEHVCSYYEHEIERAQYRAMAITEMLSLVLLAVTIGGTVIALYLPIFKLAGAVGG